MIYYGILQKLIINVLTLVYLTYKSIQTLEKKKVTTATLIILIKKWICYAFYLMIEYITDILFHFMPFSSVYYVAKLLLFLWIIQKNENITKVYKEWVLYYYYKHKEDLDKGILLLEKLSITYKNKIKMFTKEHYLLIKEKFVEIVNSIIIEKLNEKNSNGNKNTTNELKQLV